MKPMLHRAAIMLAPLTIAMAAAVQAAPPKPMAFLDPASVRPALLLPPPPPPGSPTEKAELAELHALIAAAPPKRIEQAIWDDAHEDPSLFNAVLGRDLATLPATWSLLTTVQDEVAAAIDVAKEHFARMRPYGIDPTLHSCEPGPAKKPTRSYPSGHSGLGYSVGYVLAQLMPDQAPRILTRAADYALSREYCAVHFPSDTEASHVIATTIAIRLLADPRLADRIARARAELAGSGPAASRPH